jgi:1-aminocyclopropane-1-carboxylate deaminase
MALIPGLKNFRKETLTLGRTPIQPLKRLSAALGGKVEIYAKREDVNSGLAFGGNKTRKLEYLVAEALKGNYTHLVSIGGVQSNQTRQVAAVAAHLGLKCVLVQEKWVNHSEDEAVYGKVGNIQLSRILGADVRLDDSGFDIGIRQSWKEALEEIEKEGGKPFPIPAGCSEHRLGGLGFVGWAEEVREQEAGCGFKFDYIVVCTVTGSTQAGMIVGFAADGRARRVIGIDASAKPEQTKEQVWRIARNTAELVGLGKEIEEDGTDPDTAFNNKKVGTSLTLCVDVILDTRFGGPEYGIPNQGTLEAIRLCARQEGVLTDPVYEGKSMDGMIQMIRNGEIPAGSKVLYAHLGGVPALSAYSETFNAG